MAASKRSWQNGKCLSDCLSHMLEEEVDCDVTFQIQSPDGSVSRQPAHKFMLRARSPVFEAMFSGDFKESKQDVTIVDIEKDIFKNLLRYLYTDSVTVKTANVLHLLYASKKYMLDGLEKKCEEYLDANLDEENVCELFSTSLAYRADSCVLKCLEFISPRIQSICITQGFNKMSHESLLHLLQCDTLYTGAEPDLYKACLAWARSKLEKDADYNEIRSCLGSCLYEIQYALMSPEQFANDVGNSNILTDKELSLFYGVLLNAKGNHRSTLSSLGFNIKGRLLSCKLFSTEKGHAYKCVGQKEIFKFVPDKSIKLLGFSIFLGNTDTVSDVEIILYKVSEQKIPAASQLVVGGQQSSGLFGGFGQSQVFLPTIKPVKMKLEAMVKTKLVSRGSAKPVPLFLDKALEIFENEHIEVHASISGTTGYGCEQHGVFKCRDITFSFKRIQWASQQQHISTPSNAFGEIQSANTVVHAGKVSEILFLRKS